MEFDIKLNMDAFYYIGYVFAPSVCFTLTVDLITNRNLNLEKLANLTLTHNPLGVITFLNS